MKRLKGWFKFLAIFLFIGFVLALYTDTGFALDRDEVEQLKDELEVLEQEDPDLAEAVREELGEAIREGEIDLPERDEGEEGEEGEEEGERGRDEFEEKIHREWQALVDTGSSYEEAEQILRERYGDSYDTPDLGGIDIDLDTEEGREQALERLAEEKEDLLAEGFTESEIHEIEDRISRGEDPREIFERHAPEFEHGDFERGDFDRDINVEDMEREFIREMGREPTDRELQEMERSFERGDFEHEAGDFEKEFDMEREFDFEREFGMERETDFEREFDMERETDFEREFDMERETDFERDFEREYDRDERDWEPESLPPPE